MAFLWGNLSPRGVVVWGWIFWFFSWPFLFGQRRNALANLSIAFPESDKTWRKRTMRRMFHHFLCSGLDWLHFLRHPEDVSGRLRVTPEFRDGCIDGVPGGPSRPVLFCTPHLGNWEMESHISLLTGGHPGAVVVARFTRGWLNFLAEWLRTGNSDTVTIPAKGAARGVLKALREGRHVGMLIDQNVSPRHGGIFVKFFGLPAATSPLPAALARRLKTPVRVVACLRDDDTGKFYMDYEPLPRESWEYPDDEELTSAILTAYEALIRRHPEQYLWIYHRWRYIPSNLPPEKRGKFPFYALDKKYPCPEDQLP